MSCRRSRPELGGYILGGLDPSEHQVLEEHLAVCDRCRDDLEELADLPELLAEAWTAPQRAPTDLRHRVLAQVGRRTWRRRRVPALLAAAIGVVAAVAGGVVVAVMDRPPPADTVLTLQGAAPVGIVGEAAMTQVDAGVQLDLDLAGLQTSEEGYYHAWLHRDEVRVSAGTFVGTSDGEVTVQLLCGGRLEDYDRLTVTWHPFDGPDELIAVDASFGRGASDVGDEVEDAPTVRDDW